MSLPVMICRLTHSLTFYPSVRLRNSDIVVRVLQPGAARRRLRPEKKYEEYRTRCSGHVGELEKVECGRESIWSCGAGGGIAWTVEEIAEAVGGEVVKWGFPGSVCTDSRRIQKGEWFLALVGAKFDAHEFLQQALDRGCAGVIGQNVSSEWPRGFIRVESSLKALHKLAGYVRGRFGGPVVGVTGSTGKTTARTMISLALQYLGHVHQTEGNFNNHIGVPLTLLKLPSTASACVLEMGMSNAGEIGVLAGMAEPSIRVLLNVGPAHMENFKSLNDVAAAKGELLESARPGDVCILNADDPLVMSLDLPPGVQVILFGTQAGCHVKLVDARPSERGRTVRVLLEHSIPGSTCLEKRTSGSQILSGVKASKSLNVVCNGSLESPRVEFEIPCPGLHLALNACAAAAVGVALGVPLNAISNNLKKYCPIGMRCRLEEGGSIQLIDDSYNSNPMSLTSALGTLSSLETKGRRLAFLGDMLELGALSNAAHKNALFLCEKMQLDFVGLVGPSFSNAAQSLGLSSSKVTSFQDSEELASFVGKTLRAGDAVLVKGSRGMRMEVVAEAVRGCLRQ